MRDSLTVAKLAGLGGFRADASAPFQSLHVGGALAAQTLEWEAFNYARSLNETAALQSISMGLGQVLGANYQRENYASPQAMFSTLTGSIRAQLDAMFSYIAASPTCLGALRSRDFETFAVAYNGAAEPYASLIGNAAAAYLEVMRRV
jgi:hypothetical protein